MKNKTILLLVFFLAFMLAGCSKQKDVVVTELKDPKSLELDAIAEKYHREKGFNGAILVAKEGKVLLKKGYGLADYEAGYPIESNTKFKIASVTKQFTAVCIMILEEKELLSLEDTLDKYIPDFPDGKKIKIHNLLNHTSGIVRDPLLDYHGTDKIYSVEELIDSFKKLALESEPGDKTSYSNCNYILLGYIIEKVSGMKYEDFVNKNIFEPLEMYDTAYNHYEEGKQYAKGYLIVELPDSAIRDDGFNISWAYAAGALHSTVDDLYKWDQTLYTEKLVKRQSLDKMFIPNEGKAAFGWFIPETGIASHAGGITGFRSIIVRDMNTKSTIIILSNSDISELLNMDTSELIDSMVKKFTEKLNTDLSR
jgi:CubicO group peptidase (beta-lactamase class C family)